MKDDLTFEEIKKLLPIETVLAYMGFERANSQREVFATYKMRTEEGRWGSGPKFMLQPASKGYPGLVRDLRGDNRALNVIQLIKQFPNYFPEYKPGMKPERLVNLVCRKLLSNPEKIVGRAYNAEPVERDPFDPKQYKLEYADPVRPELAAKFQPWFRPRKIGAEAQQAFAGCYFLATSTKSDGQKRKNLGFPMYLPGQPSMAGMEERGYPDQQTGKSRYKGVARGSDCSNAMWIAQLSHGQSWLAPEIKAADCPRVFWFESALDAMAFYDHKMATEPDKAEQWGNALYVSTAGQPSRNQVKNILSYMNPDAKHCLCFDNDPAGQRFCLAFALEQSARPFKFSAWQGLLTIGLEHPEQEIKVDLNQPFDFDKFLADLGLPGSKCERLVPPEPCKDWNEILMGATAPQQEKQSAEEEEHRSLKR